MEDITFFCKHCGHELVCDSTGSGQTVPCPECKKLVTIPAAARSSTPEVIKFTCPSCKQKIEAPSDMQGEDVDCPVCGKTITVQISTERQQVPHNQITTIKDIIPTSKYGRELNEKACPFCGESILSVAIKCKHCGSMLENAIDQERKDVSFGITKPEAWGKLGIVALIVPLLIAFIPLPNDFMFGYAVGIVFVLVSSVLVAAEAYSVGAGNPNDTKPNGKRREGPILWFLATLFVWAIAFPLWMFRRSQYGLRNLGLVSIIVVVAYFSLPFIMTSVVENSPGMSESRILSKEELRQTVEFTINRRYVDEHLKDNSSGSQRRTAEILFKETDSIMHGEFLSFEEVGPNKFEGKWRMKAGSLIRMAKVEVIRDNSGGFTWQTKDAGEIQSE